MDDSVRGAPASSIRRAAHRVVRWHSSSTRSTWARSGSSHRSTATAGTDSNGSMPTKSVSSLRARSVLHQLFQNALQQLIGFLPQVASPAPHRKRPSVVTSKRCLQAQHDVNSRRGQDGLLLERRCLIPTCFAHDTFDQRAIYRAPRVLPPDGNAESGRARIIRSVATQRSHDRQPALGGANRPAARDVGKLCRCLELTRAAEPKACGMRRLFRPGNGRCFVRAR